MARLDSTQFKPLFLLAICGPLLILVVMTQLDLQSSRQQAARSTNRRLRAIAQTAASGLRHSDREATDFSQLTALAKSLFVRLEVLEVSERPRVLFDSQSLEPAERQESSGGNVDWNARELYLALNSGTGDDERQRNGVRRSLVAVQISGEQPELLLRVSAPTLGASGFARPNAGFGLFIGLLFTGVVGALAVTLLRASQTRLDRLAATHRTMQRLVERDDAISAADANLAELTSAFVDVARRLEVLVSTHRVRITELQQATTFLETVLEAMDEGVIVVDPGHRIAFANHAAAALLKSETSPAKLSGRPMLEIIRNPVLDETLKRIDDGHDRIQTEFALRGEQRVISLFATRLRGEESSGAMLVLQDVTDLRRLENLRKDFVSNVSHELKTPLAGIQAYSETLLSGAIDDADACHRFVTRIQEQSDRLHDLVQDLLSLGRIEAGQEAFKLERVSLTEAVLTSVETHQPAASSKQISIELDSESDQFVTADRKGLQTIFDNLISNAVKYTPESGRVQILWRRSGSDVLVDVIDSGVGIPSDHLPRIFERFYRVDEARSRDIGGTGLGLSIVKHLANEFGGGVEVHSEPGKGSTFTVRLRAA
ncbi:MAG: sensor histidine kinase [Planctomycetota bacterium]|jgi:two-component system phosphate regulon sensor histidine kinase PhoR